MIFIVEDEPVLRKSLVDFLSLGERQVEGFESAEAALEAAQKAPPDVIISDLQLPGMGGLELLSKLADLDPSIVRIAITAHASTKSVLTAMRSGCYEYLEKPLDLEQLERLVDRAVSEKRSRRELGWLRRGQAPSGLDRTIVGESEAMAAVRRQIEVLGAIGEGAPPVLVRGETGVGKGLIARSIHLARFGEEAPFIEVNCAALPANLIEAELFGHERSAFTGATAAKPGLFEAAAGGTIFLDEIGELDVSLQPKLLSVVESGRVRRLGGLRDRPTTATVIAATNALLDQQVKDGRFRADLFHRLAAFTIEVPPLRTRSRDAVLLARSFLSEMGRKYRRTSMTLSAEAEERIAKASWPGNVRELRFAIERAVILSPPDATPLAFEHIRLPEPTETPTGGVGIDASGKEVRVTLPDGGVAFDDLERAILLAALDQAEGNVAAAARLLRVSRETMRYRLKKLGIDRPAG